MSRCSKPVSTCASSVGSPAGCVRAQDSSSRRMASGTDIARKIGGLASITDEQFEPELFGLRLCPVGSLGLYLGCMQTTHKLDMQHVSFLLAASLLSQSDMNSKSNGRKPRSPRIRPASP